MNNRFSKGNRKLSKNVLIWNLPRLSTCPGAGECKEWCYEIKIERMYKQTVPFRKLNLRLSARKNFVNKVVEYLNSRKEKWVRIHESGDFYNQEYLDKWKEIARQCPTKGFFCFTKSLHLNLWKNKPRNLQIMQSYGSKWDHLIDHKRATNRAMEDGLWPKEELCSNKGCGETCIKCMTPSNIHLANWRH